jgi:hypothetical protein
MSADSDGYRNPLEAEQIERHVAECGDCRLEIEQLREVMRLLDSQNRRVSNEKLWSAIEPQLTPQQSPSSGFSDLRLMVPIAVVLVAYKLFEQLAVRNTALQIKLVPLLAVIVLFALLKENPFKINADLQIKGE